MPVHLAGNIGAPALDLLDAPAGDLAVVELSSYQIADLATGPEVAVVTNLFTEHLDWHVIRGRLPRRQAATARRCPGVRRGVVNGRDPALMAAARGDGERLDFGRRADGWHVTTDGGVAATARPVIVAAADAAAARRAQRAQPLRGADRAEARRVALPPLPGALDGIHALPHRLEVVLDRDGVVWVDDSISTTPESTLAALAELPGPRHRADRRRPGPRPGLRRARRELAARDAPSIGLPVTGARLVRAARAAGRADERVLGRRTSTRRSPLRAPPRAPRRASSCSHPPRRATTRT